MIMADRITTDALRRGLSTLRLAGEIYLFDEVESTNTRLRTLARRGAREGTVVIAEGQTAGRGRRDEPWFSPNGVNLYASVLFRSNVAPSDVGVFAFVAALALTDAIKDLGLMPTVKWPNDVLVEGKKVAGALVECVTREDEVDYVILGVGVNLNVSETELHDALGPAGRFASSLSALTGGEIDRSAFAASYLNHLEAWVRRWEREGAAAILAGWRDRDILTGRRVEVRGERTAFTGRVDGVGRGGCLLVRDTLNRLHEVLTEEVRLAD